MKRKYALLVVVVFTFTAFQARADVPMLLNYQGRLTDPAGNPEDGAFTMTFAIFDA